MRVEAAIVESQTTERDAQPHDARRGSFRDALHEKLAKRKRRCCGDVPAPPVTWPPIADVASSEVRHRSVPGSGVARVSAVVAARPAPEPVATLEAQIPTRSHGHADVAIRATVDGLLVRVEAEPVLAGRIAAATPVLARRLSRRGTRVAAIRVASPSGRCGGRRR